MAGNLVYQRNNPDQVNEFFEFDNSLDFSFLDEPNAPNSISPEDYDLACPDLVDMNWYSSSTFWSEPLFPEMGNEAQDFTGDPLDGIGLFPDISYTLDPSVQPSQAFEPANTFSPSFQDFEQPIDFSSSIRQMVEAQAAVDTRCSSQKEKRREAGIAVHLQRLQDASPSDLELSSDSNTSFSSPCWSEFFQDSSSPGTTRQSPVTPASESTQTTSTPVSAGTEQAPGMQIVFDLNLNVTTEVPKKQRPRSQAQKENYIKARKYGACEKHKKQHKRCNCLEKNLTRASLDQATVTTPPMAGLSKQVNTQLNSLRKQTSLQSKPTLLHTQENAKSPEHTPELINVDRNRVDRHTGVKPDTNPSRPQSSKGIQPPSLRTGNSPAVPGNTRNPDLQTWQQSRVIGLRQSVDQSPSVPGPQTLSTQPLSGKAQISPTRRGGTTRSSHGVTGVYHDSTSPTIKISRGEPRHVMDHSHVPGLQTLATQSLSGKADISPTRRGGTSRSIHGVLRDRLISPTVRTSRSEPVPQDERRPIGRQSIPDKSTIQLSPTVKTSGSQPVPQDQRRPIGRQSIADIQLSVHPKDKQVQSLRKSQSDIKKTMSLTEYAGGAILQTLLPAASFFWQTSFTSWVGACFSSIVTSSFKKCVFAKKGLELY